MHPTNLLLSLISLASVAVSTKDKDYGPRCPEDEYYNKMMESKNRKAAVTDCAKWLGTTITEPNEIPQYLKDCGGDKDEDRVSRVSAACSCIETSSVPLTFSTSSHVSSTTSSTAVITTSSRTLSRLPSSSASPTGSTSQTQSTPSSSRHSSTTSTRSSSSHPPSGSSVSTRVISSTTSSHEVLPTVSSSSPSSHGGTSSTGTHPSVSSSTHISTSTSIEHTTSSFPPRTSTRTSQSVHPSSSKIATGTSTASTQTILPTTQSTVTAPGSIISSAGPSQASTTSFTTSTIYTESIYTITSCSPGKSDCPAASTVLVTSTIAISTTICPVTETARPTTSSKQTTTRWTTTTIYSTTRSTLIRCPPGASNCPVGNLPISTVIPVSTTVLPVVDVVPTPEQGNQGGSDTKKEGTPTQPGVSDGNQGKPDVPSSTFTVVTVPTTIHTIMNGVSAQILTVVPVTSALGVGNNADSAPTPSSAADADPHAGNAQQAAAGTGTNSGVGNEPLPSTHEPSHPHAAPTDASFDATAWQATEPSRSGLTSKPMLPANNTPVTASTSSRPPVVTAGVPGLVGGDGMRVAFFVFALAALL